MYENEIAADKVWLDKHLDEFGTHYSAEEFLCQKPLLKKMIHATVFDEDESGVKLAATPVFSLNQFDQKEDEKAEKEKTHQNLLKQWEIYLSTLKLDELTESQKAIIGRQRLIAISLANMNNQVFPAGPTTHWWKHYLDSLAKDIAPVVVPVAVPVGGPSVGPAEPLIPSPRIPLAFVPSSPRMAWLSTVGGFAAGAGMSYLLNSGSRAVICTAMGFVGFPGWTILTTGLSAALLTGGKNIVKNRHVIADHFNAAEGNLLNKLGAGAVATGRAINIKEVIVNGGIAAASTFAGGIIVSGLIHTFSDVAACVANQLGLNLVPEHQFSALMDLSSNQQTQIGTLQTDLVHEQAAKLALEGRIDDLQNAALAPDANSVTSLPPAAISENPVNIAGISPAAPERCMPSYISDRPLPCMDHGKLITSTPFYGPAPEVPAMSSDVASANPINAVGVSPDAPGITAVHAAVVAPMPDVNVDSLKPDATSITVVKGDCLTHLIEQHYGIKEGSESFDKVMTELARANGLVGAQENWLKPGWKLELPSLNPESVTANIDRAMLDANWRAGNVVYSNMPKMALAA